MRKIITICIIGLFALNVQAQPVKTLKLSDKELLDKIKGGWAGQTIGVVFGAPTEFKFTGTYIQDYQPIPWAEGYVKYWWEKKPGLFDDIYNDCTFVEAFDELGLDCSQEELAKRFAFADYHLAHANQAGRYNIRQGIMPPASGHWLNNPHADDLDFQIEADFIGLMAPAMLPIDEVVQAIEKYDLVAIPVVDSIGRLVGQITVDDVMDEVREQSERDYQLASGLSQDVETDDNVLRQTTARLPWLLIGMIGGIGNSMILGNFDSTFAAHPEMALYIPLIGGTGGNVGTQSSAIIVQGLANSSLDAKNTFKQITKESVVALINATIISLLVYTYNFIRFGATATVTYSVSISLFAVVMFASIFGTLVPMTLEKFKIDPAIATGPFIAITNDIIGMMLYMGITVLLS